MNLHLMPILTDGSIWLDPPGYWDNVIFPAYLDAHRAWYEGGDVVNGKLSKAAQDEKLALIEETEASDLVNQSCQVLLRKLERM
jgi:nicotinamide/nicotinate riboside kinase